MARKSDGPRLKSKVLCVDDEPHVLDGLKLGLARSCEIHVAGGGAEALESLEREGPFEVIVSDMQMPGMDGVQLLARAREVAPDTVRLLLTGHAELDSAIAAINDGRIFRFLTKPCPVERLVAAIADAAAQHRLITAERELLEHTLTGSLRIVGDVLALANPEAFGHAIRAQRYALELADHFGVERRWELEAAAILSQVGIATLDPATAQRLQQGLLLSSADEQIAARVLEVNERLLSQIPRLEGVRAIIGGARWPLPHGDRTSGPLFAAELLRAALEYDRLDAQGWTLDRIIESMRERSVAFDPRVVDVLAALRAREELEYESRPLPLAAVEAGNVFAEDVTMRSGVLLASRGYAATATFLERASNLPAGAVIEPVYCRVRRERPVAAT